MIYRSIALVLVGLAFFFAGFLIGEIHSTSEVEAANDWQKGYVHGYKECQWDVWKKFGIECDESNYQPATIQVVEF